MFCAILVAAVLLIQVEAQYHPTVTLPCGGQIAGNTVNGVNQWLGIRYASTPQRWQYTQALPSDCYWPEDQTLIADTIGNACMQTPRPAFPMTLSEDCLNLNVFQPSKVPVQIPVVFWIHGGSNVAGSNAMYEGLANLATQMSVVVVAVNYRLGSLGFLALKELSERSPLGSSGNYAIADLVAALEWTQRNIGRFGGNASEVTLMGQSSGGTNIFALLAATYDRPQGALFHNVISLSGSPNISVSLARAESANAQFALHGSSCEFAPDVYECLMNLTSLDAMNLYGDVYDTNVMYPCDVIGCSSLANPVVYLGLPIVDGIFLRKSPLDALRSPSSFRRLVFQSNQGEGEFMPLSNISNAWSTAEFTQWITNLYVGSLHYPAPQFASILTTYLNDPTLSSHQEVYQSLLADSGMSFAMYALARNAAASNFAESVHVGYVRCRPSSPVPVPHGSNATMAFHMWDYMAAANAWGLLLRWGAPAGFVPTASDVAFGAALVQQWALVVRSEAPWEPFSATSAFVGVLECSGAVSSKGFRGALEGSWRSMIVGAWEDFWWVN